MNNEDVDSKLFWTNMHQTTQCPIPEDINFHSQRHDSLKHQKTALF